MAVIYMEHPIHGTKVAVSEAEAIADEAKGWARYDVGTLLTPQKGDNTPTPAPVSAAPVETEVVPQRRGRRRKEQTI